MLRIHALWQFYRYQLDIKSERRFQGRGIGEKYNAQLNTDGRNYIGSDDWRDQL
jgi:hypothetical protein